MVKCISIKGNIVEVPNEKLIFRIGVYAIIRHNNKILMLNTNSNDKLFFPGGAIEIGETIEKALKREVKGETGIEIKVEKFLSFKEHFFYYDPLDEACHSFSFFYVCKPTTFGLVNDAKVRDDDAEKPRWHNFKELKKDKSRLLDKAREIFQLL